MRAFTTTDFVQGKTGTAALATSATVTTDAATIEGHSGVIVIHVAGVIDSPEQWDPVVTDPTGGLLNILFRADLPDGESSWGFTSGGTGHFLWKIEEWGNVAWKGLEGQNAAAGLPGDTSIATGNAGFTSQYVLGIAAFELVSGGVGSAWPTISYSNSFVETDVVSVGDGTASGDVRLYVARRYGVDGDTGPWSCTATFTGTLTNKSPRAALAVFGAVE